MGTYKKLIIEKGKHYSNIWFPRFFFKKEINFNFKFETTPNYNIQSTYKKDTQKIFGLSDGIHHHRNSIRIGWRKVDTFNIEFLAYYYNDGKHNIVSLGVKSIKDARRLQKCSITIKKDFYLVVFNNKPFNVPRTATWFGWRYLLFPMFGDKSKVGTQAPHNIRIELKWGFPNLISWNGSI